MLSQSIYIINLDSIELISYLPIKDSNINKKIFFQLRICVSHNNFAFGFDLNRIYKKSRNNTKINTKIQEIF